MDIDKKKEVTAHCLPGARLLVVQRKEHQQRIEDIGIEYGGGVEKQRARQERQRRQVGEGLAKDCPVDAHIEYTAKHINGIRHEEVQHHCEGARGV